jgi:two-component system, chemotaxis family, CheB/CheR fusion protein
VQKRKGSRTTSERRFKPAARRAQAAAAASDHQSLTHENAASKGLLHTKRPRHVSDDIGRTRDERRAVNYAEAIVNAMHTPLIVLDEERRIISASESFYRLFDCHPTNTLGQQVLDIAAYCLDVSELRTLLERIKDSADAIENFEIAVDVAPNDKRRLIVAIDRIGEPDILGKRILVAFDDITAFRNTEQQLDAAKQAAERANLGKSRFLAAASHDLRQPLQTLSLLHATLRQLIHNNEALGVLAKAARALDSMSDMLSRLLDINQLEAGNIRPNTTSFPVNATLNLLKAEFADLMRGKDLRWRVVPCALTVRSDHRLLQEMLRNLLTNAVRYTDRGGVLLGCRRHGDKLSIEVWDTGIGIAEHEMARIFQEYHQASDSPQRGGLGLGLAIVQHLGQLLSHAVRVRSRLGKGSVFAIEVPIVPSEREQTTDSACLPADVNTRFGTVLIIEYDPSVRESLELMLKQEGHEVIAAETGDAALAHVAQDGLRPDLVISDYTLSGAASGTQIAHALRASLGWSVPVIILTGDTRAATLEDIAAAGCINLSKPVTADDLLRVTQQCLLSQPRELAAEMPAPDVHATVFVVDDNRQTREALRDLLAQAGYHLKLYASAQAFLDAYRPDEKGCLITDIRMPGMGGFELLARLAAAGYGLPTIVITGQGDIATAVQAMKAGAVDFIEKPTDPEALLRCISRALKQVPNSDELSTRRAMLALRVAGLTTREREVLELVVAGHANKEIAYRLNISQRTVESHRATVMKKMGASSLSELIHMEMDAR